LSRRRIVVVDQYFPPDTAATAGIVARFARVCAEQHVPVTVVCGRPSYDPTDKLAWRPLRRVRTDGAVRYVIGSTGFDRRSAAGRVVNYVTFMLGAAWLLPFVCGRAAVVVMTDPPMAPLLAWWVRRVGRPASVAVWIQDLHPDFGVAAGLLRDGGLVRMWRRALRAALRAADDVVVLGRDMARRVDALGVAVSTHVVHNGWYGVKITPARESPNRPLKVMHFGNLGFAGPWPSVLAAARELQGVAEFVFVGGGAGEAVFGDAPPNVTVAPRIPHTEVTVTAAAADLLLVGVKDGLEGYVVPSKGYEMMALGRPLLMVSAPKSELRLLVEEIGCGIAVDDDPKAIAEAVQAAADGRVDLAEMAMHARRASSKYARDEQLSMLVDRLSPA
jgi:glycosyltransferase involved in cell wall biosynthesis